MILSKKEINDLTHDLNGTDHDWKKYRGKAQELLTLLSKWKNTGYNDWMLRYNDYGDSDPEVKEFGKKILKYFEEKKDYEMLYKFLSAYFIVKSDLVYFKLISQKTRSKLAYLDNDHIITVLSHLRDEIEEWFSEYIEEDLMYAIADAGQHISNVWWYFLWNHHLELEKKIVNSLSDEKAKKFIRWMLWIRILNTRMKDIYVDSWFISEYEADEIDSAEEMEEFETVKKICDKDIENLDNTYNYFWNNKLINGVFKWEYIEKGFSEKEVKEIKDNYIQMIDALDSIQKKLTEYVRTLPKKEIEKTNDIQKWGETDSDDLPF